MPLVAIHDKTEIETYARRNPLLHLLRSCARRIFPASAVCARLCQALLQDGVEQIGLNVKADNHSAIACYTGLGFEQVAEFGAYSLEWSV